MIKGLSMSKSIILSNIKNLSNAVITQNRNVEYLSNGVNVPKERMSSREECSFLSWFSEDGKYLKTYVHGSTLDEIASLYSQWFETYEKIYKLFYTSEKKGWLFKKFKGAKKLDALEKAKLEAYVDDLQTLHEPLLRKLEILGRRVEHNTSIDDENYQVFVNNSHFIPRQAI